MISILTKILYKGKFKITDDFVHANKIFYTDHAVFSGYAISV